MAPLAPLIRRRLARVDVDVQKLGRVLLPEELDLVVAQEPVARPRDAVAASAVVAGGEGDEAEREREQDRELPHVYPPAAPCAAVF